MNTEALENEIAMIYQKHVSINVIDDECGLYKKLYADLASFIEQEKRKAFEAGQDNGRISAALGLESLPTYEEFFSLEGTKTKDV